MSNNNKQLIIGFAGAKGSGKDTGFKLIDELYPNRFQRVAFADPIKNTICQIFGLTVDQLNIVKRINDIAIVDNNTNEHYGHLSGRNLVREIGMLMRNYDDQQFNRYVENIIKSNRDQDFIITDVRFDNEIELIKRIGGVVIRVDRDCCLYDNHVTEQQCQNPDYIIDNNTSIDHYKQQLKDIIQCLENR